MSRTPPPVKTTYTLRRDREFLSINEVDALITAMEHTRYPTRNKAIAMLLFCQALQPSELCWLCWRNLDFTENILQVMRIREPSRGNRLHKKINLQRLCEAEVDVLQQLARGRTSDWLFTTERSSRLTERSVHHLISKAGEKANLSFPIHPYMLRRSGLYYRSALLLAPLGLSLRQCCLLWNWHGTAVGISAQEQELNAIDQATSDAFLAALKKLQFFTRIQCYDNIIDYLLGAFSLFPKLENIPYNHCLAPGSWH